MRADDAPWFPPGTKLRCVRPGDGYNLCYGSVYVALEGKEEGIFPDRPFVSVIDEAGKRTSAHACRFELVQD